METFYTPNESDFKKWIREAVVACFQTMMTKETRKEEQVEELVGREGIAALDVSLVTLTTTSVKSDCKRTWVKVSCIYNPLILLLPSQDLNLRPSD